MKNKLWIMILLLLAIPFVAAVQPTQQTNKIFLSPFYTASMTAGTQYTYNVSTVVPDGISQIRSAIVTLDAWINPTRTANILVNGVACNNPSYTITTTYASAGRGVFTFDCSNAILPMRNNVVNISITGGNIGASTAWLDLTYMNDPAGSINVHGTEYVPGDLGKLFLQFLDSENNAVSNSECFLSLWYPNDTLMFNNTLMSKLDNASDGIYYKNFNVPNVEGVYPASAKCYEPLTFFNKILPANISDNFDSNSWTGGTGWATCPLGDPNCQNGWDYEDTVPLSTIVSNAGAGVGGCYNASAYCAKFTGSYGWIERGTAPLPDGTAAINISYAFKFSGWQNTEAAEFFIFDGNWHLIERITLTNKSNNVWYTRSHYLTSTNYELDQFLIGWFADSPSTGDEFFVDDIKIDIIAPNISITNDTVYQILRGSGEVHVSKLYSQLNSSIAAGGAVNISAIASAVWNETTRTLTANAQTFIGGTEYSTTETQGKVVVRMTDTSGTPVTGGNCSLTIFYNGTLYLNQSSMSEYAGPPDGVYYKDFNLSGQPGVYPYSVDCLKAGKNYYAVSTFHVFGSSPTLVADAVWNATNRNLTYYPAQQDLTNYSLISNLTASDVWSYPDRNLTYYPAQQDLTNYTAVADAVWTYNVRNLTYYPSQVDMTNYTAITDAVWSYTGNISSVILTNYKVAIWDHTGRYVQGIING